MPDLAGVPQSAIAAANALITTLRARPQMHSVRVETSVHDGEFLYAIVCSIHPQASPAVKARVPASVQGYPVRREPWPSAAEWD